MKKTVFIIFIAALVAQGAIEPSLNQYAPRYAALSQEYRDGIGREFPSHQAEDRRILTNPAARRLLLPALRSSLNQYLKDSESRNKQYNSEIRNLHIQDTAIFGKETNNEELNGIRSKETVQQLRIRIRVGKNLQKEFRNHYGDLVLESPSDEFTIPQLAHAIRDFESCRNNFIVANETPYWKAWQTGSHLIPGIANILSDAARLKSRGFSLTKSY